MSARHCVPRDTIILLRCRIATRVEALFRQFWAFFGPLFRATFLGPFWGVVLGRHRSILGAKKNAHNRAATAKNRVLPSKSPSGRVADPRVRGTPFKPWGGLFRVRVAGPARVSGLQVGPFLGCIWVQMQFPGFGPPFFWGGGKSGCLGGLALWPVAYGRYP